MDWSLILTRVFEAVVIPLLGILTIFIVKLIKAKSAEIASKTDNELVKKYINLLAETISNCVICTNQTYVDALKEKGEFDGEAQKAAFALTYSAVLKILSEEAKMYLENIYGDLEQYITNAIECEVKLNKIEKEG